MPKKLGIRYANLVFTKWWSNLLNCKKGDVLQHFYRKQRWTAGHTCIKEESFEDPSISILFGGDGGER